jgi:hypothetical protein
MSFASAKNRAGSQLSSVRPCAQQAIDKNSLPLQNLQARVGDVKPSRPVKLRKQLPQSGSRWPLHFERIALQACRIPVLLNGPDVNDFAARLPCLAEWNGLSARMVPRLFGKLAPRCCKRPLARCDQSFRDAPRALIPSSPERASGMAEQDFSATVTLPEQQNASALLSGYGLCPCDN